METLIHTARLIQDLLVSLNIGYFDSLTLLPGLGTIGVPYFKKLEEVFGWTTIRK